CRAGSRKMRFGSVLDLGCGTGLAGVAFRPFVDWLIGIDLSEVMVAEARGKGAYDRVTAVDIMTFLADAAERNARYHLLLARHVLPYVADVAPVAVAVAQVLHPDALFAFTAETHAGDGVRLGDRLRYAHSAAHIRTALSDAGLAVVSLEACSTRSEAGVPVPGLVAVARRS